MVADWGGGQAERRTGGRHHGTETLRVHTRGGQGGHGPAADGQDSAGERTRWGETRSPPLDPQETLTSHSQPPAAHIHMASTRAQHHHTRQFAPPPISGEYRFLGLLGEGGDWLGRATSASLKNMGTALTPPPAWLLFIDHARDSVVSTDRQDRSGNNYDHLSMPRCTKPVTCSKGRVKALR